MRILLTGAHGLVGTALVRSLHSREHSVQPLARKRAATGFHWDPLTGAIDGPAIEAWRPDALVHLSGENIASHRWTADQKRRIRESRVRATELLANSLLALECPPRIFIGASAVGYYGDRGDELLTETSKPGDDFLARVCEDWEAAAQPLARAGLRVVHLRFGMVLSQEGGALARMLPIFRMGLGGRLGSGRQWVGWISLADVVRVIEWSIENESARGAYNAVAPGPVTNAEFTRALARALNRPAIFPVPAFALRLAFGEMARALLLTSQRAVPERLTNEGFRFDLPEIAEALEP